MNHSGFEQSGTRSFSTLSQLSMENQRSSLEEIQKEIAKLEIALGRVSLVKNELNKNASEVKTQIHSNISSHLEALRCREVWLLDQVDHVTSVKEEVLHRQQAQLNQSLGVLQSCLPYSEVADANDDSSESLGMRMNMLDIKPDETPFLSFRGDAAKLRDTIVNYGRVDSTGMTVPTSFQDPGKPSASLPPHFEDYEDEDHHVLYKTVEEIKRTRTSDASVLVNIPKLSPSPDLWLAKPTEKNTAVPSVPVFSFPPFSSKTVDWISIEQPTSPVCKHTTSPLTTDRLALYNSEDKREANMGPPAKKSRESLALPLVSSNASIQNWLHQIKQNPDVEDEEDFEIVDTHSLVGFDAVDSLENILSSQQTMDVAPLFDSPTFRKIARASLKTWLKETKPEMEPYFDGNQTLFSGFFKDFYKNPERWLICPQQTSMADKVPAYKCGSARVTRDVDMSRYRGSIKDELHRWLKSHQIQAPEVMEVCRDEQSVFEDNPDNIQNWLFPRKGIEVMGVGNMQYRKRSSNWLVESTEPPSPTTRFACPLIEQFNSSHKNTNWLQVDYEPSNQSIEMPRTDLYTHCGDLTEKSHWLMLASVNPEPTTIVDLCPSWDKIKRIHNQMSDDCWLSGSEKQTKMIVVDDEKASNFQPEGDGKWLMSGDINPDYESHTFGPFSHDTEDIGQWLLTKKFMVETV
ncbi:hypothetical protein ScPMuIL_004590 [Solemya velum]